MSSKFHVHLPYRKLAKHSVVMNFQFKMKTPYSKFTINNGVNALRSLVVIPRLLPMGNFREPFGLTEIKVGTPSQNYRSPELITD